MKGICKVLNMLMIMLMICGCQSSKAYESEDYISNIDIPVQVLSNETEELLDIYFLDTGNSDCIFIDADQTVLIDAGDNDDEEKIVDFLKRLEVDKIDYLINTHPDADHSGGLDAVINQFEIGTVFISNGSAASKTYRDFVNAAVNSGLSPSVPLKDKLFYLQQDMYMRFYNTEALGSGNEVSLIIELVYKNEKFLFMGDAEKAQELSVLSELEDVDLIKIGHHGSRTSTSDELLRQVMPEYAVILCGKDNAYGHPHQEVLDRLIDYGVRVYRTDQQGMIHVQSDGNSIDMGVSELSNADKVNNQKLVDDEHTYYIGNLNSKKFHLDTCSSLPSTKNQIVFNSYEDAVNAGYTPCSRCNPKKR